MTATWKTAAENSVRVRLQKLYSDKASQDIYESESEVKECYRFWILGFESAQAVMAQHPPSAGESAWDYMDRLEQAIRQPVPASVPADCRPLWTHGGEMFTQAIWMELRRLSQEQGVPVAGLT